MLNMVHDSPTKGSTAGGCGNMQQPPPPAAPPDPHHHHRSTLPTSRKRDRKTAGLSYGPTATNLGSPLDGGPPSSVLGGVSLSHEALLRELGAPTSPKVPRLNMYDTYQPWVLQTYGDSAKTKTITKNKYQRILQILRGDYIDNETSKFKLWVKGRGFRIGPPPGYFQALDGSAGDMMGGVASLMGAQTGVDYSPDKDPRPDIFVQTGTVKDPEGNDRISYKKVAIVEDFFEIIYNLHVCRDGKEQKHMGQKRTYRAVSERYAFVPREAVTKFLVLCTECPRRSTGVPSNLHSINNNNNNSKTSQNNNNNNNNSSTNNNINNNNSSNGLHNGLLDTLRPSKGGSAFQPITSRNSSSGNGKKFGGLPPTHHSPSSLSSPHPLSPNSHPFFSMAPTLPTPHSIISFLPTPTAPITSLSSHSICSLLPAHTSNGKSVSQSYSPIDVVNHAAASISSLGGSNHLGSVSSLGSVNHSPLLPTSLASLSLASPFQLPSHLLQSTLGLTAHLTHSPGLLSSQLTPPLTPIPHLQPETTSSPKQRIKSPKKSNKSAQPKRQVTAKASSSAVSSVASPSQKSCVKSSTKETSDKGDLGCSTRLLPPPSSPTSRTLSSTFATHTSTSSSMSSPKPTEGSENASGNGSSSFELSFVSSVASPMSVAQTFPPHSVASSDLSVVVSSTLQAAEQPAEITSSATETVKIEGSTPHSPETIPFCQPHSLETPSSVFNNSENCSLIQQPVESFESSSSRTESTSVAPLSPDAVCHPDTEPPDSTPASTVESSQLNIESTVSIPPQLEPPIAEYQPSPSPSRILPTPPCESPHRDESPFSMSSPSPEEKQTFDRRVSSFSSAVDYNMPITTIYLKHMRDLQQQHRQQQLREQELEEEEELRRFEKLRAEQHALLLREQEHEREQQMNLMLLHQHQQLLQQKFLQHQHELQQQQHELQQHHQQILLEQQQQQQQYQQQQLQLLEDIKPLCPSFDSPSPVAIKSELVDPSDSYSFNSNNNNDSDKENNDGNANGGHQQYWDGTSLGPSSGPAGGGDSSATTASSGGSSAGATPDASAADDSKTDVKMETRGPEWLQQQQPTSLIKPEINTNTRTSPCPSPSLSDPPASIADDSSTGGGRDLDDDEEDDADDEKADAHHDPERLKAFNMFVRLFVDENLDRMVPISKQPKEKIQAIIDACGRQFPEFSERTRKRIRTYLKSCRRNKRTRDSNGWEGGRPTPPHLTSLQAEQLLATACENEAQNAKRMRLGLEPVAQPHPYQQQQQQQQQPTIAVVGTDKGVSYMEVSSVVAKSEAVTKVSNVLEGKLVNGTAGGLMAGGGLVSGTTGGMVGVTGGAVTVFQPVVTSLASTPSSGPFQQTFQHTTYQKITTAPVSSAVNGPTDLSMRGGAVSHHPVPSSTGLMHQSPVSSGAPVYTNPCVTSIGGNLSGGLGVMPNNTINIASGGNIVIAAAGTNNGLNHCGGNTINNCNTTTIGLVANSNCNTITNNNISDVAAANMTTIGVCPNNTVVNNSGCIAMVANPSIGTAPIAQGTMAPAMVNNTSGGVAIAGGGVSGGNPGGAINMTNSNMAATAVKARPTLSPVEVAAVRQLITGYRESAAFLLRSAEELQNLIHQQGS